MEGDKICNAAVLAFCKTPQRYYTTAITKCAHFHGVSAQKPIPDHKVFHGDIFEQADNATDFVLSKIATSVGTRDKSNDAPIQYEIPQKVIAEAIVNAIVHREYTSKASVQVMLFANRLAIFNPGGLNPALSIKQLKKEHRSYPTNPKLAELMYQAGYIERFGTGTKEIFQQTKNAKLKEPAFNFESGFEITIWRPKLPQAPRKHRNSTATVPHQYRTSTVPAPYQYNPSQEVSRLIFAIAGELNRVQLQEALELKHKASFLKNYLQPAITQGFIELTIPEKPNSPKQSYRLTAKGLQLQKELRDSKK